MTQKHVALAVLAVVATGAALIALPEHFGNKDSDHLGNMVISENRGNVASSDETTREDVIVPSSIEDITASIEAETSTDMSAMDEEENGETSSVREDSDNVNNLGTSYDENSL